MLQKYKLGELVDVARGTSLSGDYYSTKGEYIRLTCGNFDYRNNCFKENTSKDNLFYTGVFKAEFLLEKGDIITPLTEQAIGLLGTTALIPESGKYIQSQDIALIKCKADRIDPTFCYYLISSRLVRNQLSAAAQQTKIRHTSPDKIKACIVWVPKLDEQRAIGRLLASLDDKIQLNKRINDNLEAMAKQLYDYWFVQFDFPNEDGKPYKSSGGAMVWNEKLKREIPKGWSGVSLKDLALTSRNAITPVENEVYQHFSIPSFDAYGSYSLDNGSDIKSDKFVLQEGQLLVSKLNPWFNRVVWVPKGTNMIGSTEFVVLNPNNESESGYIYSVIKSPKFIAYCSQAATGTSHSQRRVSPDILMAFKVVYEQGVVQKYGCLIEKIQKQQAELLSEIAMLTKQRDELLPLLMNGQASINSD
mgnify:FL=1